MKKKILSAVLCATTLFSAVGFSACEVTDVLFADYKEQIAEMQETLNAQQEKITDFESDVKELQDAITEKEEQIADLQGTINEQQEEIATLEEENENLQGTLGKLHEEIEAFEQGEPGFVLKISMEKEVYTDKEEILVEIILENHSGEDVEIFYHGGNYSCVLPYSDTGMFLPDEQSPYVTKKTLKNNETLRFTERIDDYFYPGHHVLKYYASFYLDEGLTNYIGFYSNELEFEIVAQ